MDRLDEIVKGMKYDKDGLITAVVVDAASKDVLQVAFMNAQALADTVRTGKTHFYSRSRGKQWMKGEESGHTQQVKAVYADCDLDAVVVEVDQRGGACHEGYRSCFFRRLTAEGNWEVVGQKVFDPQKVYKKKG